MNYERIYDELMSSRLLIKKQRIILKKQGVYFERHHIKPISMGGNKSYALGSDNIVLLTAREHYLAHRMLWLIYKTREMGFAFHKMVFSESPLQKRKFDSKAYEAARIAFSECQKGRNNPMWGKEPWQKGKNVSSERKRIQSEKMTGRYNEEKNPFHGRKHSKETLEKMRNYSKPRGINSATSRGFKILFDGDAIIGKFETLDEIARIIETSVHNLKHHVKSKGKTRIKNRFIVWYEEDYKKSLEVI